MLKQYQSEVLRYQERLRQLYISGVDIASELSAPSKAIVRVVPVMSPSLLLE